MGLYRKLREAAYHSCNSMYLCHLLSHRRKGFSVCVSAEKWAYAQIYFCPGHWPWKVNQRMDTKRFKNTNVWPWRDLNLRPPYQITVCTADLCFLFQYSGAPEDELRRHAPQHHRATQRKTENRAVAIRHSKRRRTSFLHRVSDGFVPVQFPHVTLLFNFSYCCTVRSLAGKLPALFWSFRFKFWQHITVNSYILNELVVEGGKGKRWLDLVDVLIAEGIACLCTC